MNTRLKQLADAGQSIWLDNIRRSMFASGELRALIDLGLRGMTSNPTIFEKALATGTDYDEQLAMLARSEREPGRLFEALAITDIQSACDEFRALYELTAGVDGLVSMEVSPLLARDTQGTIAAARRLWAQINRPNAMIKIPGTPEGVSAITECVASGININVTLLFSVEQYEAAANAYLAGIERRVARRQPVDRLASVASVFVSRIDSAVDALLQERISQGEPLRELLGKTGIATLKLTYERWKALFNNERFAALVRAGARPQRPLWGSTSTKNPSYPDLMYVENVVGRHTVNTVPAMTLAAIMDHGHITANTLETDLAGAHATLGSLVKTQISRFEVGRKLQADGIKIFADSYNAMLVALGEKQHRLMTATATAGGGREQESLGVA